MFDSALSTKEEALAKVLMPGALAEEAEQQARPLVTPPAPIYVKTIREVVPAVRGLQAQDTDV